MLRIGQKFSSGGRVTIRMALVSVVMSAGLLAGCAGRPGADALDVVSTTVPGASEHVILVASSRARDPKPGVFYNGERTPALSFAKVDITVPPTHKPGMTEIPRGQPNPATDMTVREAIYRDTPQEFTNDLKAQLALRPKGEKTVFLFVHGYNTLFSEALYRFTQMAEDSKSTAVPVMFTWASRGSVADYVYDNNSATSARDRLEETINLIFDSGAERVSIMAHSMGKLGHSRGAAADPDLRAGTAAGQDRQHHPRGTGHRRRRLQVPAAPLRQAGQAVHRHRLARRQGAGLLRLHRR